MVRLHAELRERGFTGSYPAVRDYLQRFHRMPGAPPRPRPPGVRKVTGWITCRPDRVGQDGRKKLEEILARCPELEAATGHVRSFAAMVWLPFSAGQPSLPAVIGSSLRGIGRLSEGPCLYPPAWPVI